jgi:tetratricopeptide (TPR) repeat protein
MKQVCLFFCLSILTQINSQTKAVSDAISYYKSFIKESKVSDIDRAFELISSAMNDTNFQNNDEANFYMAVIVKQYYETKKIENRVDLISLASKSLIKTNDLNINFKKKDQLLRLMQIIGYDLYSEGIRQHKENKHDKAYDLYKDLFKIQSILAQNKLDFTLTSNTGEKTTIASKDMTNNMVVFCINGGKKEEAKNLFEREIISNPSALSYARLIQLCYQIDDKASANKYIQEGILKYPTDGDLLIYAINSNLDSKNYASALKQLDEAIRVAPTNTLFLVKSQTLENQDKFEESIENYKIGLKLFSNDFDLNYGMGYALLNSSFGILNEQNESTKPKALVNVKQAKEYFLKAQSINPTKVDFEKIFEQINNVK